MRTPTSEQRHVLETQARVRVVRAAPGAGKTWLVAEVIRQELDTWPTRTSGIAALSFTRVGGDEIRRAIGHELGHPHFVGTIDAFLFRYVIRPHLRRVYSWFANPRLVGESGAEHWNKCGPNQLTTVGRGINLFGCVYIGEENGTEVVAYKSHPTQPLTPLDANTVGRVGAAKKKIWKERGLLTYSDAALWASKILEHPTMGPIVRGEIIQRFPLLIVDELQDTGHFLGKSIRLLLGEPRARGVLVGDPDQAIYEFNGARPDLFNTFEAIAGALPQRLARSLRCPLAVTNAATHVKDSVDSIDPAESRAGRAFLLRYSDSAMVEDVSKTVKSVRASRPASVLKVIARAATTVEDLIGRRATAIPALYCPPLTHIHRAVVAFRRGKNALALSVARAALERAVFEHEGVSDEELAAAGVDSRDWKALAIRCLLGAVAITTTGTSFDWQAQAGELLDREISAFGLGPSLTFVPGKLKPKKGKGWAGPSSDCLPQPNIPVSDLDGVPVQTVHGVKGETHDVTIFVCPTSRPARCPSIVWWSTNDKDREERRIAYVAMTRTQGDLIVCVSNGSYQQLRARHAEFVSSFECMAVDEFVAMVNQEACVTRAADAACGAVATT